MDKVFIENLEIETVIGIHDWEKRITQKLLLDLELAFDNREPAATDDIAHTLDYEVICNRLVEFVTQSRFQLVETLAENCAQILLNEFGVSWLRLKLTKPTAIKNAKGVGVIIERLGANTCSG